MATGIAVPVRVGPTGGTVLTTGDAQADKVLQLSLSNGDNDNAFQLDITLGTSEVFAPSDPGFRARVIGRVFRIFGQFESVKRFKLVRNSIRWQKGPKQGEQTLNLKYRNLESDEVLDFSRTFGAGRGGL